MLHVKGFYAENGLTCNRLIAGSTLWLINSQPAAGQLPAFGLRSEFQQQTSRSKVGKGRAASLGERPLSGLEAVRGRPRRGLFFVATARPCSQRWSTRPSTSRGGGARLHHTLPSWSTGGSSASGYGGDPKLGLERIRVRTATASSPIRKRATNLQCVQQDRIRRRPCCTPVMNGWEEPPVSAVIGLRCLPSA